MNRDFLTRPHDYTRTPRTASRHQLGWRELNQPSEDDALAVARGIFNGLLLAAIVWGVMALAIVGAVHLLG